MIIINYTAANLCIFLAISNSLAIFFCLGRKKLAIPIQKILKSLFVAVANGDVGLAKDDASPFDDSDFLLLHDVRSVHPHEARRGKLLLDGLHAHQ